MPRPSGEASSYRRTPRPKARPPGTDVARKTTGLRRARPREGNGVRRRKHPNGTCVYCGSRADTVDHVVPLSRWRETGLRRRVLDNKSNRVPACARCNKEKGNLLPCEWFEVHPEYKDRFRREAKCLSDPIKELCGIEGGKGPAPRRLSPPLRSAGSTRRTRGLESIGPRAPRRR